MSLVQKHANITADFHTYWSWTKNGNWDLC